MNGPLAVTVFTRVADGSEAGQGVSMTLPDLTYKTDMTLVAYRGVAADAVEAFATSTATGTATQVTPAATSGGANRTELSFWADRSSSTNEWTAPAEVNVLSTQIGTGGGRVTTLLGEREVGAGVQGGLTATTNAASARSATITLILAPGEGSVDPNVAPTASASFECTLLECAFNGAASSDTDGTVVSYAWDFGDGSTSDEVAPTHTYSAGGAYGVSLVVTDDDGAVDEWTDQVTVEPANTAPVAAGDISCVRLECSFDGAGSSDVDGTVVSYAWNFGDGATSDLMEATHTYAGSGTFDVTLTVTDDDGAEDVYAEQIVVDEGNDAPVAEAMVTCDELACTFVGSGSSDADGTLVSYAWTFGDGGSSDQADTTHTYVAGGDYEVTLTVVDDDGAQDVVVQQISPQPNRAPEAVIAVPSCDLLVCDFSGADSMDPDAGDSVVSWTWNFGDGSGDSGESVSHTFGAAGTYQVQLTVADVAGLTGTVTREVTVSEAGPVVEAPQLVGVSAVSTYWTTTPSVTVPADIEAGDLLVLFVTSNQNAEEAGPTGVGAWVREDRVVNGPLAVTVFTRVADGSEAGQGVSMTLPDLTYKTDMTLVAYRGVAADAVEAFATSTATGTATQVTPAATSGGANRTELSFWADRSSSTNEWTAPAEVNVLSTQIGTGGGRVTTLLGEREVGAGVQGGLTATTNAASARSATITLILAPA